MPLSYSGALFPNRAPSFKPFLVDAPIPISQRGGSVGIWPNQSDISDHSDFTLVTVLADLGIPEGQIVDRYRGGDGVLKKVLEDVKKYAFSGYVKLMFELNVDKAEGVIGFNSGEPLLAIYIFKKGGAARAERIYKGGKAVEYIWEDSLLPESTISLHSRIQISDIEHNHPDAKIGKVELMPPPNLTNPRNVGELQKLIGKGDEAALRIIEWGKEGYSVSNLVRLYLSDPHAALRALPYFEANIQRLAGLEEILRFLDTQGYEREAESLMRKMRDPERLLDIEAELESLRRRIEGYEETELGQEEAQQIQQDMERKKVDEKIDGVYDLILQYHKTQGQAPEEVRVSTCPDCGGKLDARGNCPACPVGLRKPSFGRTLNPRYTFETFVTGPNSNFAVAAAQAVAESPGKSYNPLFIYSRSGLGKTHLLESIGNLVLKNAPGKVVIFAPTDVFEQELIEAVSTNRLEELHFAYRNADVLLLDDVQFLAGKERIQEELFQTFNDILERGGQVALTSDRQPKEIPSLSERLITRFESGLVADIAPPDMETRLAILDRRVRMEKLNVPKDVLTYIADACKDNVRQLEGGLNRVVAFSSLMKAEINLEKAHEILRVEVPKTKRATVRFELIEGHSYLLEEDRPDTAHRLLVQKIKEGRPGLGIIRGNPKGLRSKIGHGEARLLWLTDRESKTEKTVPPSLERIVSIIQGFVEEKKRVVILLDDIQYLISNTNFEGVIRFVRNIVDEVSEREAIFIVSLNPESLRAQERSILERELEVLRTSKNET